MKAPASRLARFFVIGFAALSGSMLAIGCSSSNSAPLADAGVATATSTTCDGAPDLTKDDYCAACSFAANATPTACKVPRTINACCAYVQPPSQELVRSTGLYRYSSSDPTLQLGCLDTPAALGTPKTITLTGFVRLFSSGNDSAGVKIEIFKEGTDGALGELVGTPATTTDSDAFLTPKPDWLKKCPDGGCTFRAFKYEGVPTETPLVVKTSDAKGGSDWSALYDYNVFFSNDQVGASTEFTYEPQAVAATDINTVASAAGGLTVRPDKGVLAGEVHDCGDVRISGATVDTDTAHEGDVFYFGDNEADPLPDRQRNSAGTSRLGLFGTINIPTGTPIRVRAVGTVNGQTMLLGSHTVQAFPGAVTALSFRGRRPWQK